MVEDVLNGVAIVVEVVTQLECGAGEPAGSTDLDRFGAIGLVVEGGIPSEECNEGSAEGVIDDGEDSELGGESQSGREESGSRGNVIEQPLDEVRGDHDRPRARGTSRR